MQITGIPVVLKNLDAASAKVAAGVEAGLKAAGLLLQKESQRVAPIEFGFLKASAYTRKISGSGLTTVVEVGYTESYAVYVHEAVGMVLQGQPRKPNPPHKGSYWDVQGVAQAKFLEEPARRLSPQILQTVYDYAKQP